MIISIDCDESPDIAIVVLHFPKQSEKIDHQTDISRLSRPLSYILRLKNAYKYWNNKI